MGNWQLPFYLAIISTLTSVSSSVADVPPRIVCYYGSWSNSIDRIPGDKCTHIYYSFIELNDTTWRYRFSGSEESTKASMREFLNLRAKYPDAKLLLAIGGAAEGSTKYSLMAELFSRRAVFIQSIVELLTEFEFDGVDMDWEFPGVDWEGAGQTGGGRPMDKENLVTLIEELRAAFDNVISRPMEITMAVGILESFIVAGYDVPRLCGILDAVHLMNYALRGSWDKVADIHSLMYPRPWDEGELRRYNTEGGGLLFSEYGCPRQKLIVGVAFFGHAFVLQNARDNKPGDLIDPEASRENPERYLTYAQICQRLQNGNWTRVWDDEVKGPYMTKDNLWVGYDDAESIAYKMDWLKNNSFGGAMMWAIEEDDHQGRCGMPLVSVMFDKLQNYTVPEAQKVL